MAIGGGYLIAGMSGEDGGNTSDSGCIAGFYDDGAPLTEQMYVPTVESPSSTQYRNHYGQNLSIGGGRIVAGDWMSDNKEGNAYLYLNSNVPYNSTFLNGGGYFSSNIDPGTSVLALDSSVYGDSSYGRFGKTVVANDTRIIVGSDEYNSNREEFGYMIEISI